MGIYVMNRHVMIKLLKESFPTANDLKNEVIPGGISLGLKVSLSYKSYKINSYKRFNDDAMVGSCLPVCWILGRHEKHRSILQSKYGKHKENKHEI